MITACSICDTCSCSFDPYTCNHTTWMASTQIKGLATSQIGKIQNPVTTIPPAGVAQVTGCGSKAASCVCARTEHQCLRPGTHKRCNLTRMLAALSRPTPAEGLHRYSPFHQQTQSPPIHSSNCVMVHATPPTHTLHHTTPHTRTQHATAPEGTVSRHVCTTSAFTCARSQLIQLCITTPHPSFVKDSQP